ncbi:MAG: DUF262 domain-containing protein [Rhodothermaceae bacterium]|nr:DUF262 domain-containing protein [Rhodothermaceae bacterium]
MKITPLKVTVRELVQGYEDSGEDGVVGYGGKLDIRPPYQREFVYDDDQQVEVIRTVLQGFPLNVIYWADKGDRQYEIIDGQQRTLSIAHYVDGDFSVEGLYFNNQPDDIRSRIWDYVLMVYVCKGKTSEKLAWFKRVNIAGEELTPQELLNSAYTGPWLSDAKRKFSQTNGPAYRLARHHVKGTPIRQELLEIALKWINNGDVRGYMGLHQNDPNAQELWLYFKSVIKWVKSNFKTRPGPMKSVNWGRLHREHSGRELDPVALEEETLSLINDEDVTKHSGIYEYILTRDERHLNIRAFDKRIKQRVYERQKGCCAITGEKLPIDKMEADHITPWSEGGQTVEENCQMLSKDANRRKGAK